MVLATWLIPQRLMGPNPRSQVPQADPPNNYPGL
jgi:hypothetical protein